MIFLKKGCELLKITIGQYYPVESIIHRIDPRMKILLLVIFISGLFFSANFLGYIVSALFLGVVIKLSKVPFIFIFRGLRGFLFIILFTVVINMFFIESGGVFFEFYFFKLTYDGVWFSVQMICRLGFLTAASSLLTFTTSPIQLTHAIERILKPFSKIGVPAHDIAMMMTIAIRFIPTLLEEVEKIRKAQMARGADFDVKGIKNKAKAFIPLLVPLFVSAFRRADDLAMAMEARCYRGDVDRTAMYKLKLKKLDYYVLLFGFLFLVFIFFTKVKLFV